MQSSFTNRDARSIGTGAQQPVSTARLRARCAASSGGRAAERCGEVSGRKRLFASGCVGSKQPLSQHRAGSCLPPAALPPITARCHLTLVPSQAAGASPGQGGSSRQTSSPGARGAACASTQPRSTQPVGQGRALPAQTAAAALCSCARQWWDAQAGHEELKGCCIYESSGARRRCAQQELRSAEPRCHRTMSLPGDQARAAHPAAQQDFSTSFSQLSCLSPSCHYIFQYLLKKQKHGSCATRSRLTRLINPELEGHHHSSTLLCAPAFYSYLVAASPAAPGRRGRYTVARTVPRNHKPSSFSDLDNILIAFKVPLQVFQSHFPSHTHITTQYCSAEAPMPTRAAIPRCQGPPAFALCETAENFSLQKTDSGITAHRRNSLRNDRNPLTV